MDSKWVYHSPKPGPAMVVLVAGERSRNATCLTPCPAPHNTQTLLQPPASISLYSVVLIQVSSVPSPSSNHSIKQRLRKPNMSTSQTPSEVSDTPSKVPYTPSKVPVLDPDAIEIRLIPSSLLDRSSLSIPLLPIHPLISPSRRRLLHPFRPQLHRHFRHLRHQRT